RRAGDPSADVVIGDLARTQQIRAVSQILRHLVDNDQPVPDELPPSIARWLEQTAELPTWVDRDRFERGCRLVVEHGPQVCVVLATASLVYCYAGYPGVKVLTFSRRLDHDAVRRVGETAQFVLNVMAPGSLGSGGRGIRKIQKVRLLHAGIRHLVTASRRWDLAGDGGADLSGGPGRDADVVLIDRRGCAAQARRARRRRGGRGLLLPLAGDRRDARHRPG